MLRKFKRFFTLKDIALPPIFDKEDRLNLINRFCEMDIDDWESNSRILLLEFQRSPISHRTEQIKEELTSIKMEALAKRLSNKVNNMPIH